MITSTRKTSVRIVETVARASVCSSSILHLGRERDEIKGETRGAEEWGGGGGGREEKQRKPQIKHMRNMPLTFTTA